MDGYFSRTYIWQDTTSPPVSDCLGACRTKESGKKATYAKKCKGGNKWGPWEGVEGHEEGRTDYKPNKGKTPGHTWYSAASFDCISAIAWTETPVPCVISYTTRVVGPMKNPQVAQQDRTLRQNVDTAFTTTGKTKPVLCTRSTTAEVGSVLDHYGQWKVVTRSKVAMCTLFTYHKVDERTKKVPANRIGDCQPPGDAMRVVSRVQVFCHRPGWTLDWNGGHSYTPQDCLTRPQGVWSCGLTEGAWLDGREASEARPAEIVNDGTDHTLEWYQPAPTGAVRGIRDQRVRLRFIDGTPFRGGDPAESETQPFVVNPTINDWVHGWSGMGNSSGTDFTVNFQSASVAGRAWGGAPQWAFSAEFGKTVPHVLSVDALTGVLATAEVYDWERLSATCDGSVGRVSVFAPRQR